jgi:hypothetical protein
MQRRDLEGREAGGYFDNTAIDVGCEYTHGKNCDDLHDMQILYSPQLLELNVQKLQKRVGV